MEELLKVENLRAGIDGKEILRGINLTVRPGEVHAEASLMSSSTTARFCRIIFRKSAALIGCSPKYLRLALMARIVAGGVNKLKTSQNATIVITHYQRLLDYIKPDYVHILYKGRIVHTGGPELALEPERCGKVGLHGQVAEVHTVVRGEDVAVGVACDCCKSVGSVSVQRL
mgnify:CR=1 FL=1